VQASNRGNPGSVTPYQAAMATGLNSLMASQPSLRLAGPSAWSCSAPKAVWDPWPQRLAASLPDLHLRQADNIPGPTASPCQRTAIGWHPQCPYWIWPSHWRPRRWWVLATLIHSRLASTAELRQKLAATARPMAGAARSPDRRRATMNGQLGWRPSTAASLQRAVRSGLSHIP